MSIISGTLTVNPAFLHEIKEDNRQLCCLFEQTLTLLASPRRERISPRSIVEQLGQLRDQLGVHFALEDTYGYFQDAIETAPRLSEKATKLHAEHEQLFLELCRLVEAAEQLMYHERPLSDQTELAVRFYEFHARFQAHETRENELILDAFDEDIGVGD